jgi:hypothetical protein
MKSGVTHGLVERLPCLVTPETWQREHFALSFAKRRSMLMISLRPVEDMSLRQRANGTGSPDKTTKGQPYTRSLHLAPLAPRRFKRLE